MKLEANRESARAGRLYPSVILHGGHAEERQAAALELARTLLCGEAPEERPCGSCRHCRRILWPGESADTFHPDFMVLERDLRTSTSVDATKGLLQAAQLAPFEARGQVFIVADAASLSVEASNVLLKVLEEPRESAPRHFFLLAPSQFDLLPTLRSRSLALYLGAAPRPEEEQVAPIAEAFAGAVGAWMESGAAVYLQAAAGALLAGTSWDDPRAGRPWSLASAAVLAAAERPDLPAGPLLALAEGLLEAPPMRLRGIPAERILEGLVSRHLALSAGPRIAS
ncbi:MAG: hypothetical protein AAF481_09240 [Acidobacteriota bacterium]